MQKKINIQIVPIFDQKARPEIWRDFGRIEKICDTVKYNYHWDESDTKRVLDNHAQEWQKEKYNFAFGAYDGNKMVGFATGYKSDKKETYLHNLYVLPQYNGRGIGKQLLAQCENTANLVATDMSIVAFSGAVSFYEQRGYTNFDNRNMHKHLTHLGIGVVPVFKPLGALNAKMKVALTDADKAIIKKCKNQPVFVYVSFGREIDAVAVQTSDKQIKIWTNKQKPNMSDFYTAQLQNAFSKLR